MKKIVLTLVLALTTGLASLSHAQEVTPEGLKARFNNALHNGDGQVADQVLAEAERMASLLPQDDPMKSRFQDAAEEISEAYEAEKDRWFLDSAY